MGRTFYIADVNGDTSFQHVELDILDEPICMNVGVAFMPFMEEGFCFLKEENITSELGFNEVETGFVEYLYKIRQHNRNNSKLEYKTFSGPNRLLIRERVFIAGKIFPAMSISYSGKDIDCSTAHIQTKMVNPHELRLLFGEGQGEYKAFGLRYISIDNDNIRIYLPKETEIGINYASLLTDFLTNGPKTKVAATNGEFPNMEIYTMATGISYLTKACWLTKDREEKNNTWKNACMYIVEHKLQGVMGPFGQIADFYYLLKEKVAKSKHKSRWLKGGYALVNKLTIMDGGFIFVENDVEIILSELNIGICDYAITKFHELLYGKLKNDPLDTMEKAYKWDLAFVQHEQGVVAVPIYAKTSENTTSKFQAMADKDGQKHIHGLGGILGVTPEFDDPWNGDVKDAGFRTDLPMLMLWLDRHKPTSAPFIGKVDGKGFLLEKYKKIIRRYEAK
jgi:hypothetical protein